MDIVSQIAAQPLSLTVVVAFASLLLGLLIPRRGGANWLGAVVFFLPNLFLDMLDMVHTKKFKYYGLILALLSIEAFFAFRASTVYYDVLNNRMPGAEMAIVCVIVFVAIFLCGYMVATHGGKWTFARVCTMIFVIIHDWAGTVWMNYSQAATTTTNATISAGDDPLKVILTIGMCVLGLLPFIMGAWAEELRPELEEEQEEEVNSFTGTATRKIKRRAVEKVLRLANRTDVVQLVRALPANEFADFKQFVMPIIAPGVSYNLDNNPVNQTAKSQSQLAPISPISPVKKQPQVAPISPAQVEKKSFKLWPFTGRKKEKKVAPANQQPAQVESKNEDVRASIAPENSDYSTLRIEATSQAQTDEIAVPVVTTNLSELRNAPLVPGPVSREQELSFLDNDARGFLSRFNEVLSSSELDEHITNPPVSEVLDSSFSQEEPELEPQENPERTTPEDTGTYQSESAYNSAPAAHSRPSAFLAPDYGEDEETDSGKLRALVGMSLTELLEYEPLVRTFRRVDTREREIKNAIKLGLLTEKRDHSVTRHAVTLWLKAREKALTQK